MAHLYQESHGQDPDGSSADPMGMDALHGSQDQHSLPPPPPPPPHSTPDNSGAWFRNIGRFGTMSSLFGGSQGTSSPHELEEAYYVGGSERSGQQVVGPHDRRNVPEMFINHLFQSFREQLQNLDPPSGQNVPENLVDNLFQSAREHGAEATEGGRSAGVSGTRPFQGTGYRLGEAPNEPLLAVGESSTDTALPQLQVTLKLWRNGFSVDSGDLRPYTEDRNRLFLESVQQGRVPEELTSRVEGREIQLKLEDHQREEFVKPKTPVTAFTGTGHMLGSPVPSTNVASTSQGERSGPPGDPAGVDLTRDLTTVQIRLASGQTVTAKFNTFSTIGDVRSYILSSHAEYAGIPFVLKTHFPSKELREETQTLQDAGLCNAVIVQFLT